jgi:hypothetical protein
MSMAHTTFVLDKEKYLKIAKTQNFEAALTQLHLDTNAWEIEAFEGEKGYQPDLWKALEEVRSFSRSLWDMSAVKGLGPYKK